MSRFRRPSKGKKIKPTFFVFCEGKTEQLYVNLLKTQFRVPIIIDSQIAKNRITSKYITNYKKGRPTHEKDKTFLLYDLDVPEMLEKLQSIKSTVLLVSNPCIELWFLLHFKEQKSVITCKKCNDELKKQLGNYSKVLIDDKMKVSLIKGQQKAINRAKKLQPLLNPGSTVHLLIEELKKVKEG